MTNKEKQMLRDCGITPMGTYKAVTIYRMLALFFGREASEAAAEELADVIKRIAGSAAADRAAEIRSAAHCRKERT